MGKIELIFNIKDDLYNMIDQSVKELYVYKGDLEGFNEIIKENNIKRDTVYQVMNILDNELKKIIAGNKNDS